MDGNDGMTYVGASNTNGVPAAWIINRRPDLCLSSSTRLIVFHAHDPITLHITIVDMSKC
jgi:hypothetical protein